METRLQLIAAEGFPRTAQEIEAEAKRLDDHELSGISSGSPVGIATSCDGGGVHSLRDRE